MARADVDMDIQDAYEDPQQRLDSIEPMIRYYQASELVPDNKGPLHDLLQKQPAVLGMVSGLLSVGVGILFAVSQEMYTSLCTLFRVSHLTGTLFILAGVVSNLLFKYPQLLPVSFGINCGCIFVSVIAACLISVDLAKWDERNAHYLKMEVLELCVLGLEVFLSAVLCFWFSKQKRTKSP
ncbi:uncharacterized protein si:ch211-269k10.4 isoform X2 [Channa argus]|uniref:uncharacterized protein si:ch211-269k10.4 isoform X2 n=1 Tax=Channa argus TaxID=215402 RepID=UPI00352236F7